MNKKRQRQDIGGDNGFEQWGGYMAAKKNKLADQFKEQVERESHSDNSTIFKGVSIFVNGYTVPSADDLKRIMMIHGGTYHHYYSSDRTTHIIASNLPDVKIKQLKSLHIRVVKPEWITACLDAGHQIDYRPFLLYSHQSTTQQSIMKFAEASADKIDDRQSSHIPQDYHTTEVPKENVEDPDLFDDDYEPPSVVTFSSDSNDRTLGTSAGISVANKLKNKSKCATEPSFLSDFYGNSRLHHISTMGATFKQYVNSLRQNSNGDFPGRMRLKNSKKVNAGSTGSYSAALHGDEDLIDPDALSSGPAELSKVIMHIDMDCFFVSVGLRNHAHLKGKPVAVTHSKGSRHQVPQSSKGADRKYEFSYYKRRLQEKANQNSKSDCDIKEQNPMNDDSRLDWMETIDDLDSMAEIASCSYEARSKGVRNGMFMGTALKLCPNLEVIPYDFEGYKEVAYILYNTVASYTLDIEAVSCDEMFVDCTSLLKDTGCSPLEFAACLREEIREKTQCPASTGFGANRLLARLATRKAKPDGMFYLESTLVENFMKTVKVTDLPGVGYAMASRLKAMGVVTCEELQKTPLARLREFGTKTGEALFDHCRGRDERSLNFAHQRKSVSAEVNYGIRFRNSQDAEAFLQELAIEVQTRLKDVNMKGRCVTLKLMVRAENAPIETAKFMGHGVCDNITKSSTLLYAICDSESIFREVFSIFKKLDINPCDLRGVGIQVSRLESMSDNKNNFGALSKFLVKKSTLPSANQDFPQNISAVEEHSCSSASNDKTNPNISSKTKYCKSTISSIENFMVARKKSTRRDNISKLPAPSDLDLAVFSALPEDIRNEILEEYSRTKGTESKKAVDIPTEEEVPLCTVVNSTSNEKLHNQSIDVSFSQVDPTFLEALPTKMRSEIVADLRHRKVQKNKETTTCRGKRQNNCSTNVGLCNRRESILSSKMSPREVRDMVCKWVSEEKQPLPCDAHILKHYFQDLVVNKSIDDLYTIIRGLYRCVSKRPENAWVEEYRNIILSVQTCMEEVYHSRLQVEESIHPIIHRG